MTTMAKKKQTKPSSTKSLIDDLKDEVIKGLESMQNASGGRDGLRSQLVNMMNPSKFDSSLLVSAFGRTQTFHGLIKAAKDKGELSPFIMPMMAAIAFESVFHACSAFWLMAGEPKKPGQLN